MMSLELLPNEYFDQTEVRPETYSQEVIDAEFSAIVETLGNDSEQYETLRDTPFLNKPEAPDDLMGGKL